MATVEFKSANAAWHLLTKARAAYRLPSGFVSALDDNARKIAKAQKVAAQIGDQATARLMTSYRGRKSDTAWRGVRCECCGALLTNPESIAAGRGPTCQAN